MAQVGPVTKAEAQGTGMSKEGSSQNSFHSFKGSEEDVDPSPRTGPQHFYIGEPSTSFVPGVSGQGVPSTSVEDGEAVSRENPCKAKSSRTLQPEGFPSPVRPKIVRYPLTPGGTEIRPPSTTPPVTPGRVSHGTPPTFGSPRTLGLLVRVFG